MEGDEMKGLFKLCLAGIMQTDIDEYKNAVYLETGEYFCEDHLRPHIRNNPEPLVMMVAKHNTHILTLTPEHYTKYIKPGLERGHQWKQEYLAEQQLFAGYSSLKLSAMASVAQVCTFRAGEAIVEQGRTKLTRYSDHHDGVFFMLSGQASCFKQVEPVKPEKKKDSFMERLEKEAEKKSKEDSVRARRASPEVPIQLKTNSAKHSTRHAEAALRRQSIQQAIANQRTQATRRQSIEARTFEMLQPAAAPAPPLRSESRTNRMGGPGQLYENMLMPLDDIQFGLDFKLASVCMSQADLRHLIGQDFEGLKALRRVSDAIVLCDNPDDFEGNSSMDCATVYLKGAAHDVDLTLRHLHTLGLNLTGGTEVHPYAPAELVMAVAKEHVGKVLSLMPEIAHDTHTEIHPNHVPSKMTAVTIIGREGDCRKAQQRFQSQLEKQMWTVEMLQIRPAQMFGLEAYMEGAHPMMEPKRQPTKGSETMVPVSRWKATTVLALAQVQCLVMTVNDFGDFISAHTHQLVKEAVANGPSDDAVRQTLSQYKRWDQYKRVLTAEIKDYNADRNNFGLPHHMPILEDRVHGNHYLHMYVERDGPEKSGQKKPHRVKKSALLPPKIGLDLFSRK
eukprot:TRINITY_DN16406_c0_g1_i1.p1 TRINITY_DN16406_c0_g1~~TRINITY_DN16406_c0_g1_i1.p1  ORF type:complete len:619 (+),score=156.01 TRINITY_DN16406_c0_g1_i1:167-2023(+)